MLLVVEGENTMNTEGQADYPSYDVATRVVGVCFMKELIFLFVNLNTDAQMPS